MIGILQDELAEALPALEPGQHVVVIGDLRKDEEIAGDLLLLIADSPEAALNRFPVVSGQFTLDAEGVALRQFLRQAAQRGQFLPLQIPPEAEVLEDPVRLPVAHDELVLIVKEDDALADVLKHRHGQGLQHVLLPVFKGRPVHQVESDAVTHDGIVHQGIAPAEILRVQKHRVHHDNHADGHYDQKVLLPILSRRLHALGDQDREAQHHQQVGEAQVHIIKRLHLIGIVRDHRLPLDVVYGDLPKDVDNQHQTVQHRRQIDGVPDIPASAGRLHVREHVTEVHQRDQHPVDHQEIDAGRHGGKAVGVTRDAGQIGLRDDSGGKCGQADPLAGGRDFLGGFPAVEKVKRAQQDENGGDNRHKTRIHSCSFPSASTVHRSRASYMVFTDLSTHFF